MEIIPFTRFLTMNLCLKMLIRMVALRPKHILVSQTKLLLLHWEQILLKQLQMPDMSNSQLMDCQSAETNVQWGSPKTYSSRTRLNRPLLSGTCEKSWKRMTFWKFRSTTRPKWRGSIIVRRQLQTSTNTLLNCGIGLLWNSNSNAKMGAQWADKSSFRT